MPGYTGVFARTVNNISYFPTPLLEALLEWILLWTILIWRKKHIDYPGQVWVWFLGFYGFFRIIAEFFRTPDLQIGYFFWWITMGQILSVSMILAALVLSKTLKK
jgi:phosphatidylglycerol:prolipoprotein diacylglycerol transferase